MVVRVLSVFCLSNVQQKLHVIKLCSKEHIATATLSYLPPSYEDVSESQAME